MVSCALVKRRPRKFGIGLVLRQTMSLSTQKPNILHDGPAGKNFGVGADPPQRRRRLHQAAAGQQPGAGEVVIGGEGGELVPVVVDGVDMGFVGTLEVALEPEV